MALTDWIARLSRILTPTTVPLNNGGGATALSKPDHEPKINAEHLLMQVLPKDLYVSLSALGYCDVEGKTYKSYRLFRNQKTQATDKDGRIFSSCIYIAGDPTPDTDRIVAEYLLILNDEAKYLETANLSQISSGQAVNANLADYQRVGGHAFMATSCGVFQY